MNALLQAPTAVPLLLAGLGLHIVVALVAFVVSRWKPAVARSALLMQVLLGAFVMMIVVTPWLQAEANAAGNTRFLNLAVFLALVGMLKLLGRFEE
jgi:hypothetical protein